MMLPFPNSKKKAQRFFEPLEAHSAQCECCNKTVKLEVPEYGLGLRCPECNEVYFQPPSPLPYLGLNLLTAGILILNVYSTSGSSLDDPNAGTYALLMHYMPYFWPLCLSALASIVYGWSTLSKAKAQLIRASRVLGLNEQSA